MATQDNKPVSLGPWIGAAKAHRGVPGPFEETPPRPIAITLVGSKYRFIGPIYSIAVHERACVQGFDNWGDACDYARIKGYQVTD